MAIFIFLFSLATLSVLICIALRPSVFKPLIRVAIDAPSFELDEQHVLSRTSDHVLYGGRSNVSVVVFLIGGAFLYNDFASHYGLSNELGARLAAKRINLLMLRYPVRFDNTVHDAMLFLNDLLKKYALCYKICHMLGFSAGALLAGMFVRKERSRTLADLIKVPQIGLDVRSYVGICGLYDSQFDNAIVTNLFDAYIMRGTPEHKRYHCRELGIPAFIVSSTRDILFAQTQRYAEAQPCTYKIFDVDLPHGFVQCVNLTETQEALRLIVDFIVGSNTKKDFND